MEPVVKRRLLIALIIIALIIIFLPIPFGHFKLKKEQQPIQNIPPTPSQPSVQSVPEASDSATLKGFTPNQTPSPLGDGTTVAANTNNAGNPPENSLTMVASNPSPVAPAQSVVLTTPVRANPSANVGQTANVAANNTSPTDAAGSGKLPNYATVDPLPDTDGSNTAPLAGDDVSLPATPKIVDETQSNALAPSVDTSDMDVALPKHKAQSQPAPVAYHVRADDVTSSNVVTKSNHIAPTSSAKSKKVITTKNSAVTHHQTQPSSSMTHAAPIKGESWVVQMASFSNKAQAQKVIGQLNKQGHKAFITQAKVNGHEVYRANIGPFTSRDRAEQTLQKVNLQSKTKGYVHQFAAQ